MKWFLMILLFVVYGCRRPAPGFDFDLFKGTAAEELASAVKNESKGRIKEILRISKISPDTKEPKYGHTLLMLAVVNNLDESVQILLEAGADPNMRSAKNEGENTPMFLACNPIFKRQICDLDVMKLLIDHKGNVNDSLKVQFLNADYIVKYTPLIEACKSDCLDLVKLLVENGADINSYDYKEGFGPISKAIIYDNLHILKYLVIDKKAKIPKYCYVRQAHNESPRQELTVTDFLNEKEYKPNSKEYKLREEILDFLHKNNER